MSYNPQNPNGQAASANSAPVVVASDQSAVPVSASSLPLPSGAATAAKQPALGTAGSASADVITVQGKTSMTPILTDGSAVTQPVSGTITANAGTNLNTSTLAVESGGNLATIKTNTDNLSLAQGSTTSGQKGSLAQGAVTTAAPTYTTAQTSPLSLDTTGNLRVTSTPSGTQTVSGTVAATQSGTWTVQPGNTANTTAWKVDGSAVTQPISGTITANAGTNLNTSALALDATLTGGTAKSQITDGAQIANTIAGDSGQNALLTAGNRKEVSTGTITANGNQTGVDCSNYSWVSVQILTNGSGSTVSFQSSNDNSNWYAVFLANTASGGGGTNASSTTSAGIMYHGAIPGRYFRLSNGSGGSITAIEEFFSTPRSNNPLTSQVISATQNGAWSIGQSGTWTVQPGNTANTTAWKVDGSAVTQPISGTVQPGNTANTTPWLTTNTPATTGGWTTFHLVSAATTNSNSLKGSAGQVGGWFIYNSASAVRKVAFHNQSSAPTAGSSIFMTLVIPPNAGANVEFTNGISFSSGIGITTVTGLADSDNTAIAANDLIINIFYK